MPGVGEEVWRVGNRDIRRRRPVRAAEKASHAEGGTDPDRDRAASRRRTAAANAASRRRTAAANAASRRRTAAANAASRRRTAAANVASRRRTAAATTTCTNTATTRAPPDAAGHGGERGVLILLSSCCYARTIACALSSTSWRSFGYFGKASSTFFDVSIAST